MGHYTRFRATIKLKHNIPIEIIDFLHKTLVIGDIGIADKQIFNNEDVPKPQIDHPFFKCERWYMLFHSTNWDDKLKGGQFYQKGNGWIIDLETEFKNYGDEIEQFIDWIKPYVKGRKQKIFLGWSKGEMDQYQINYYKCQ